MSILLPSFCRRLSNLPTATQPADIEPKLQSGWIQIFHCVIQYCIVHFTTYFCRHKSLFSVHASTTATKNVQQTCKVKSLLSSNFKFIEEQLYKKKKHILLPIIYKINNSLDITCLCSLSIIVFRFCL
jgi:hypothetical protein